MFEQKEVCTHSLPNKIQFVSKSHEFLFEKEEVYKVQLLQDYKVQAIHCSAGSQESCQGEPIAGKWTAIYDQTINVELDNGIRFVANLRYDLKETISADPLKDAK